MSAVNVAHPWILGSYAVYAPSLHAARRVYELVCSEFPPRPFGTVILETGDEIDWINMRYRSMPCLA
ncbi:MAG TPA: hypothetical protein VJ698_24255 [Noviherbaspirillum sp.]|uniref:hypothetical protein n=1 Tax=Noviherbaspirillum sp. TaxID=1926288 RepID=UPI002B4A9AAD|nr:hypothetical protein [Noviherbaspirillum sp.]HJV88600.1 hypothetical protein [Noviherbaspirillum sp.]